MITSNGWNAIKSKYTKPNQLFEIRLCTRDNAYGEMAKVLDCDFDVSLFEPQPLDCVLIWTNTIGKIMNFFISKDIR